MAILGPTGTVYGDRADILASVREKPMAALPVWAEVLPVQTVPKKRGSFGKIGVENFTNRPGAKGVARGSGAGTKRIDVRLGEITFQTKERSLSTPYDDSERGELEDRFQLETAMVEILYKQIQMEHEYVAAGLLFSETTFPLGGITGFQAGTLWSSTSAKPKDNAQTALGFMAQRGADPMDASALMSYLNFLTLLNMESMLQDKRYLETPSLLITEQNKATAAAQLGVKKVIVGGMYANTAGEGLTPSLSPVWSDNYVLFGNFGEQNDDPYQRCLGRSYACTSFLGAGTADSYRDDDSRSDMLRFGTNIGHQINFANCGVLVKVRT